MKNWWVTSALALGALFSVCGRAHAEAASASTNAQCAQEYEQGQEQRKSGQLLTARATLRSCSRDACPDFIRTDCANWYTEVQNELPTLVFAARSGGRDVADVRVSTSGRVLASRLDGRGVELDPGEHDVAFEAPGMQAQTTHLVVARGERNRLVLVELAPMHAPPSSPPRSRLVPGILAGVGALGLAGFAGFGAWGHTRENELERACAPNCSDDQIASAKSKYVVADVSLGLGVASLALSAYFFFRPGSSAPRLAVAAGPSSGGVVYGGAF